MKKNDLLLIGGFALVMAVINIVLVATHRLHWVGRFDPKTLGTMVAAAITIAVMSQLYKDNALFKLAEHMLVGSALAYGLMVTWYAMWVTEIIPALSPLKTYGWQAVVHPMKIAEAANKPQLLGVWSIFLPAVLGLMMYTRLNKKYAWISRIPFAIMIGFGVGLAIPNEIQANLLKQLQATMVDLWHDPMTHQYSWNVLFAQIAFVGVMATLVYFFFSVEHKGAFGAVSRVGVWFLMIAFGASFGYTVQGRLSLLLGRINYLFHDWLAIVR
ncbi:MAG: hypothetical protein BIFFINMI_03652 [Phycisphaerae bacterium]|nr:hypothetical protein [Phycisphaerae bacterium]